MDLRCKFSAAALLIGASAGLFAAGCAQEAAAADLTVTYYYMPG